jgi:DNA-binding GntR family transcriptional regulator
LFEPGERLKETKLATRVGVSRGPIREALRMLTQEGLVEEENDYLFVYRPKIKDVIDVYLCRQSLESLAIKLAVNNIKPERLVELKSILSDAKSYWEIQTFEKVIEFNTKFHQLIIEASENKQLILLTEQTGSKVMYIRSRIFQAFLSKDGSFIKEHEEIYQALVERNEKKAEQLMFNHIQQDINRFYHYVGERG